MEKFLLERISQVPCACRRRPRADQIQLLEPVRYIPPSSRSENQTHCFSCLTECLVCSHQEKFGYLIKASPDTQLEVDLLTSILYP